MIEFTREDQTILVEPIRKIYRISTLIDYYETGLDVTNHLGKILFYPAKAHPKSQIKVLRPSNIFNKIIEWTKVNNRITKEQVKIVFQTLYKLANYVCETNSTEEDILNNSHTLIGTELAFELVPALEFQEIKNVISKKVNKKNRIHFLEHALMLETVPEWLHTYLEIHATEAILENTDSHHQKRIINLYPNLQKMKVIKDNK